MTRQPNGVAALVITTLAIMATMNSEIARASCEGVQPVAGPSLLQAVPVITGLTGRPLYAIAPPGDRDRVFIVEQSGFIRLWRRGDPGNLTTLFLDLSTRVQAATSLNEMGLLGLTFDPGFASTGKFYVNYTEGPVTGPWFTVIARYSLDPADPDAGDFDSEERVLRFAQPENNHNGGQIWFGPDGFLYIASGDGGGGGDVHGTCGNGQNLATLLGKLLRIDVRGVDTMGRPPDCGGVTGLYTVPLGNPLVGGAAGPCEEIWVHGLRNPWRSAVDAATGDLYIADVGQQCWEEVNYAPAGTGGLDAGRGANFGWRQMEGNHCYKRLAPTSCNPAAVACAGSPACFDASLKLPILEYAHTTGCSITGGVVYRGCLMPWLAGAYFYGDYCSGSVSSLKVSGGVATDLTNWTAQLNPAGALNNSLTSFGLDTDGEIYICDRDGTVSRILPAITALEVSGTLSSQPFTAEATRWHWEDLRFTTMQPVATYRVYRGQPAATFTCVFASSTPEWPIGDPAIPALGAFFAYVVTAVDAAGAQTVSGVPPVMLSASDCP